MGQGTPVRARPAAREPPDRQLHLYPRFRGALARQSDRGLPLPLPQRPVRVLRLVDGADAALAGDAGAPGDRLSRRRVQPVRGVLHRAREQRPRLGGGLSPRRPGGRSSIPRPPPAGRPPAARERCCWRSRPGTSCSSAGTATSSPSASTTSSGSSAACASCGATSGPISSATRRPGRRPPPRRASTRLSPARTSRAAAGVCRMSRSPWRSPSRWSPPRSGRSISGCVRR